MSMQFVDDEAEALRKKKIAEKKAALEAMSKKLPDMLGGKTVERRKKRQEQLDAI